VAETLARAGMADSSTIAEWAATPWYGPLEPWLAQESVVELAVRRDALLARIEGV
jgi:hypothetical protein